MRPVQINRKIHPSVLSQYAKKYEFSNLITDSQTRSENIAKLENIKNIDATITTNVEMGIGRLSVSWLYELSNDNIIMFCYSSGMTGILEAVTFGHKQFLMVSVNTCLALSKINLIGLFPSCLQHMMRELVIIMTATILKLPRVVMSNQLGKDLSYAIKWLKLMVTIAFSSSCSSLASLKKLKPSEFASLERFYNLGDTAHQTHIRRL